MAAAVARGADRTADSDTDSDEDEPRVRRVKRRRLIGPNDVQTVPVYSSRVRDNLRLYREDPERAVKEMLRVAELDPDEDGDAACAGESRASASRGQEGSDGPGRGRSLSESEDDVGRDTSLDRSPSPPSTPSFPVDQRGPAYFAIREVDRNLRDLAAFGSSPLRRPGLSDSEDVVYVGVIPSTPPSPREITIKVRCRGQLYRIPLQRTDRLQKVVEHIAEAMEVDAGRLLLLQREEEVPLSETPDSQRLTIADILDCIVMSPSPAADRVSGRSAISLHLQGQSRRSLQVISIGPTEPLAKLMEDYTDRMGLRRQSVEFYFDGVRLCESSTPTQSDMESGDVIDVRVRS
uniref:NFATC2-interacting protein n=1 Tax=Callorhinchus milii TaxID=7868 RepID=V9L467_CALMI